MHRYPSKNPLIAVLVSALAVYPAGGVARGQTATANSGLQKSKNLLQFDVASIKPTPPSEDRVRFRYLPDGTSFHGAPIRMVLQTAFGVDDDHIVGAPPWVNTNRYDIEAKVAPEDASKLGNLRDADRRAMLLPLLTERFNLKYHHETRERSAYALVVAKGGPRLAKGEPDAPPGLQPVKEEPDTPPEKEHHKIMTVSGHIEADSVPMSVLADQLTRLHAVDRPVVDETRLTGNYDFTLRWTPDNLPFAMKSDADGLGATTHAENVADAPPSSLLTAMQEQLGLKLVPEKRSVDVIVIDHIDPPSPN
jgi:uncharacterized protein (TIGR03435 family)